MLCWSHRSFCKDDNVSGMHCGSTRHTAMKRWCFLLRFYFVGDEDLLEIIGNSKNVARLQKHFKKMFAGVHTIILDEEQTQVIGLASKEGEEVMRYGIVFRLYARLATLFHQFECCNHFWYADPLETTFQAIVIIRFVFMLVVDVHLIKCQFAITNHDGMDA